MVDANALQIVTLLTDIKDIAIWIGIFVVVNLIVTIFKD